MYNASTSGYKKRERFYHLFQIVFSTLLLFITLFLTDFGTKLVNDDEMYHNVGFEIVVVYLIAATLIIAICICLYFKQMIITRSKGLLNLVFVSIVICLCVLFGFILPEILYFTGHDLSDLYDFTWIISIINASAGILQFKILIFNRKSMNMVKNLIRKQRKKHKKCDFVNKNSFVHNCSAIDGLLSDYFEDITKKVRKT